MTDSPSVQHRLVFALGLVGLWVVSVAPGARAQSSLPPNAPPALQQFDTAYSKHNIDLSTLVSGGPPKDGIPSVDAPVFVSVREASRWVAPEEPVILLEHKGTARAYPLQILTHHEIVNDRIAGTPVAVTFCPLCYSALVFERTLDGAPVELGVSGLLRNSDLVMYDRKTETLWQQLTGKAIVGDLAGRTLTQIPSQIVSFRQFSTTHPDGAVLSRDTGHDRPYGRNPYAGYDDIDNKPFAYRGPTDDRLPPMAKVVAVTIGGGGGGRPAAGRVSRPWRRLCARRGRDRGVERDRLHRRLRPPRGRAHAHLLLRGRWALRGRGHRKHVDGDRQGGGWPAGGDPARPRPARRLLRLRLVCLPSRRCTLWGRRKLVGVCLPIPAHGLLQSPTRFHDASSIHSLAVHWSARRRPRAHGLRRGKRQ